jgi:hypothetical protein
MSHDKSNKTPENPWGRHDRRYDYRTLYLEKPYPQALPQFPPLDPKSLETIREILQQLNQDPPPYPSTPSLKKDEPH